MRKTRRLIISTGSAAFNLLVITAICVVALPGAETKRIAQYSVFIVTCAFSCFAYIWLLLVLVVFSPDVIEVWEGVMTLVWFVLLLALAYAADKDLVQRLIRRYRRTKRDKAEVIDTADVGTSDNQAEMQPLQMQRLDSQGHALVGDEDVREMQRQIKLQYPNLAAGELARILAFRMKMAEAHDRLWYRIQVARWSSKKLS